MLFNEIKVDTIEKDGMIYINVPQLATHLSKAVREFAMEAAQLSEIVPPTKEESSFVWGLIEGMQNVVLLLTQGNNEAKIDTINTVEEFLERFNNE